MRLATNRERISLVTAGGTDGLIAGVWSLLKDSVMVGLSENNVDRFGPCPDGNNGAIQLGCIDQTPLTALRLAELAQEVLG